MADSEQPEEITLHVLAETDNFAVYRGQDTEGEVVYNVELSNLTLHFFQEEWDELVALIGAASRE